MKIQSSFRGHKARKDVGKMKDKHMIEDNPKGEEVINIDLEDPEVDKAPLKIQSSFRGHKARKDITQTKGEEKLIDCPNINKVKSPPCDESIGKSNKAIENRIKKNPMKNY